MPARTPATTAGSRSPVFEHGTRIHAPTANEPRYRVVAADAGGAWLFHEFAGEDDARAEARELEAYLAVSTRTPALSEAVLTAARQRGPGRAPGPGGGLRPPLRAAQRHPVRGPLRALVELGHPTSALAMRLAHRCGARWSWWPSPRPTAASNPWGRPH